MASCWHFVRDTDTTCCWRYTSDDDTAEGHITEYRYPNEPFVVWPDYDVVSDEDTEQISSVPDTRPHATPLTPRSMESKYDGSDGDAPATASSGASPSTEVYTRVQELLYLDRLPGFISPTVAQTALYRRY